MSRIIHVNGRYLPRSEAMVPVEDRGYMFGDGVFEGFELRYGRIIDLDRHLDRLDRSLSEIRLANPPNRRVLRHILHETVRRNRYRNGFVYLQVTRGVAPRDYRFPPADTPPAIVCVVYNLPERNTLALEQTGIKVITCRDIRWRRPDIKSLQLLPGVLARQKAAEQGGLEAWLVDDQEMITEGAASNAWIITGDNQLITRQADHSILKGITRRGVAELLQQGGLTLIERAFSVNEACEAKEAFITSATLTVMPVIKIDDHVIGSGKPGKLTLSLRARYGKR